MSGPRVVVATLETGVAVGTAGAGVEATGVGLTVGTTWGAGVVATGVATAGAGGVGAGVSGVVTGVGSGVAIGDGTGVATVGEDTADTGADAGSTGSGAGVVIGRCGCGATLQAIKSVKKSRLRIAEKSCCMPVRRGKGVQLAFCYRARVNVLLADCIVKRWCIR